MEINASRRILKSGSSVCGSVITGTDKVRSGYGNGDCLFFDFDRMVFAIADGTERFPEASRGLLQRLSGALARAGAPGTVDGWRDLINSEVYAGQKYQHKTTFSCIALLRGDEGTDLVIAHGGDSAVTVLDADAARIEYRTGPDMNFAGRSSGLADVSRHRIGGGRARIILSTDGFDDLLRFCAGGPLASGVPGILAGDRAECVCEKIHDILRENRGKFEHDDIGFIVIDPADIERSPGTVVMMGGTGPRQEKEYIAAYSGGSYDRWVPQERWGEYAGVLAGAGIDASAR